MVASLFSFNVISILLIVDVMLNRCSFPVLVENLIKSVQLFLITSRIVLISNIIFLIGAIIIFIFSMLQLVV